MSDFAVINSENFKRNTKDNVVDLTLETILKGKQVLIFNNSKNSSEATAERVANSVKKVENRNHLEKLSKSILKSLQHPTKQCKRLAKCVQSGVAFHHSGLTRLPHTQCPCSHLPLPRRQPARLTPVYQKPE